MLAAGRIGESLPAGPEWSYEVKWDGYRAIWDRGRYVGRSGRPLPGPGLPLDRARGHDGAGTVSAEADTVLDGELIALDDSGRPSFHALQQGGATAYIAFDILVAGGREVTDEPLERRREMLADLAARCGLTVSPYFSDGPATVAAAKDLGLEGVVAKRLGSRYRPGSRTTDWVKVKFVHTADLVIGGWRSGARRLGALLVGVPGLDGRLRYRGRVGGGISAATEAVLLPVLNELARADSPFDGPVDDSGPWGRAAGEPHWVDPVLVVEVRYGELTPDGRLRFPSFLRLRPDKTAEDCAEPPPGGPSWENG